MILKLLPVSDVVALVILVAAGAIVLEALGISVIDPVWQWVDATFIAPVENWFTNQTIDSVVPW